MPAQKKAIIIGAGPAGLAAALQLHRNNNIAITVYELRPEPTTMGGAIGIFPNGMRLLHRMGLYEALLARGSCVTHMEIHSLQNGDIAKVDMASWAHQQTGFGYLRICRRDLQDVLLTAVAEERIPVSYNKRIVSVTESPTNVTVTFSDGSTDTADMLIGCDGLHSSVRRLHVDPSIVPEYSGIAGTQSIIQSSNLPDALRTQANAFMTCNGLLVTMPCSASGDKLFWFFSRETPIPHSESGNARDGWEERRQREVAEYKDTIHNILDTGKGEWRETLTELVNRTKFIGFYPVFRLPLGGKWSTSRTVLLGDAAHAMQPHAGQGVSMALEDVFLLSRLLRDPERSLDDVFAQYEAIRRPRIMAISTLATKNGKARRDVSPWKLRMKEYMAWATYGLYNRLGLESWGIRQQHLVYDIDEVMI
ncbi:FAD-dependent oxidoreductase [Aspergillus ibericus CBS 121593]|uniref:FAD/NAD(P)-binding domain-containing protein n=1 Tax=Aspergillus ibericus CBS 121593 TaxID=1448316 RepID=A0A395GW18_9EURO|nr:FAD/NAD(P)-binding domain-containing protein [Aspergillus ibericus CBS 121593]RAK99770.1 FAD/NAD(P)-binding domain-containing protein [Aspergillus ibericus CBS 121593]